MASSLKAAVASIPDIQNSPDGRCVAIDQVGIKDIRYPVVIRCRSGRDQHTVANFNMYVGLPHNFKGTHMSRFVEILNAYKHEISVDSFMEMIGHMSKALEARTGCIEMSFLIFLDKAAPVSGVRSLMDYEVSFIGHMDEAGTKVHVKVVVPVTSLCPCSREISSYGAHNQRSHLTLKVLLNEFVWVEELIEMAEQTASCELYGLLKRPDEKYVTERAYDNPRFVEDMVRDLAIRLNQDERILRYTVESENFESIHNHSAYAMVRRDKRTADAG